MKILSKWVQRHQFGFLRRIRLFVVAFNMTHKDDLLYLQPRFKSINLKKKWWNTISSKDFFNLPNTPLPLDVEDAADHLYKQPYFQSLTSQQQEALNSWSTNGYAHLEGFFSLDQSDEMREITDAMFASDTDKWRFGNRRVKGVFENQRLWDFAHDARLMAILSSLLGESAEIVNSIHFQQGDEQPIHSDSFYMTTFPVGRLIGLWVALEDIHPDSGVLRYYPGSHRLPYIQNADLDNNGNWFLTGNKGEAEYEEKIKSQITMRKLSEVKHLPKKGDILLWHANLLHGGSKLIDPSKTRKSMVCHYIAANAICYHENSQRPALKPQPFGG